MADLPPDIVSKLARLAELETMMSNVRHDIRGMLTPMLLVADRLAMSTDEKTVRCAKTLITSIKRIDDRLVATRPEEATPERLG